MLLKTNYLFFLLFILIISIDKNSFAAPLCFEEDDSIENKEFSITENSPEKSAGDNKNNELEETNNTDEEEGKDIEISADKKIEVDNEQGVMIVTGNAYVKEGLTSLQADILTAFTCETKKGETKIIQINADNNVVIISDQGKAFAERGIYFVEDNIIELYDKVKLEKEGDILVGDKGIFNVSTGKGEISIEPNKEGGRKKVYGIIRSKKK